MILDGLRPLCSNMRSRDESRCRFVYEVNNVKFDVLFFIDESPFKLLLVVYDHNFVIDLEVKAGFNVDIYLSPNVYGQLADLLRIGEVGKSHLKTTDFFEGLNAKIPAAMSNKVRPQDVPKAYYRDIEEADKRFYFGSILWGANNPSGDTRPENLEKTKRLLGNLAYEVFKKHHISSRWTDIPDKEKAFSIKDALQN